MLQPAVLHCLLSPSTSEDRVAIVAAVLEWDPTTLDRAADLEATSVEAALVCSSIRDTSLFRHATATQHDPSAVTINLTAEQRCALAAVLPSPDGRGAGGEGLTAASALLEILNRHIANARPDRLKPAPVGDIGVAEKAACARREVKFRRHVYANKAGGEANITPYFQRQIAVMEAIAQDYESQIPDPEPQPEQADLFDSTPA